MMKSTVSELTRSGELEQILADYIKSRGGADQEQSTWRSNSLRKRGPARKDNHDVSSQNPNCEESPLGEIHTIVGGFVRGNTSASSRRAHARKVRYE